MNCCQFESPAKSSVTIYARFPSFTISSDRVSLMKLFWLHFNWLAWSYKSFDNRTSSDYVAGKRCLNIMKRNEREQWHNNWNGSDYWFFTFLVHLVYLELKEESVANKRNSQTRQRYLIAMSNGILKTTTLCNMI